ncbi:hypothetical protein GCM10010404_16240 [Nonomuraea africana]
MGGLSAIVTSVQLCYLDESGGCESPDMNMTATPAMVLLGLIINGASVPALTRDFLALKRRHFPGRFANGHPGTPDRRRQGPSHQPWRRTFYLYSKVEDWGRSLRPS